MCFFYGRRVGGSRGDGICVLLGRRLVKDLSGFAKHFRLRLLSCSGGVVSGFRGYGRDADSLAGRGSASGFG